MSVDEWLDVMQHPAGGSRVQGKASAPRFADGSPLDSREGVLRLVFPAQLGGTDAVWNRRYDLLAPFYDLNERVGGRVLGVHMRREREEIVARLGLQPGMRVLEVSPGPGVFQGLIAAKIGPSGRLAELDLSLGMLRACRKQARRNRIDPLLVQGNGSYLPFVDGAFDCVFHFGGVKLFTESQRALSEFVRVAKPRAVVAWGDEGFGEGAPVGWRRRTLERMNPGFREPLPPLPAGVTDVSHFEVMNGCAWLIVARKG
jgi:SAM-dependent methyltransferase